MYVARYAVTLASLFLMPFVAAAVPLAPGATVVPIVDPLLAGPGTLVAQQSQPFTSIGLPFSGTLHSAVYRNSVTSFLDFYYQVVNNSTSTQSIKRASTVSFAPQAVQTNVFYYTGLNAPFSGTGFTNTIASRSPTSADRSAAMLDGGATVGFNFPQFLASDILPGQVSAILIVRTNASAYTTGSTFLIDGGIANAASFAPVPEPGSYAALLTVGTGAFLWMRRRRNS